MRAPKVTKLDKRFKFYNSGFRFRITFDISKTNKSGNEKYIAARKWCEDTYGVEYANSTDNWFSRKNWNQHWRVRTPKNSNYRLLYVRDEVDVTMLLLVAG